MGWKSSPGCKFRAESYRHRRHWVHSFVINRPMCVCVCGARWSQFCVTIYYLRTECWSHSCRLCTWYRCISIWIMDCVWSDPSANKYSDSDVSECGKLNRNNRSHISHFLSLCIGGHCFSHFSRICTHRRSQSRAVTHHCLVTHIYLCFARTFARMKKSVIG